MIVRRAWAISRRERTVTGMARLARALRLDGMLLSALIAVSLFGLFVLYSARGREHVALACNQLARIGIGFMLLVVLAQVPPTISCACSRRSPT